MKSLVAKFNENNGKDAGNNACIVLDVITHAALFTAAIQDSEATIKDKNELIKNLFNCLIQFACHNNIELNAELKNLFNENKKYNVLYTRPSNIPENEKYEPSDVEKRVMQYESIINIVRGFSTLHTFYVSQQQINSDLFNFAAVVNTYIELIIRELVFIAKISNINPEDL